MRANVNKNPEGYQSPIMEDITLYFMLIAFAVFIAAFILKNRVIWFFTMILSVIGVCLILQDSTVPADKIMLFLIPLIFTTLISVSGFVFIEREQNA